MSEAKRRIERRRQARNRFLSIMSQPEHVVVIHYSCESFYDRPDGSSPRITSIAVLNLDSRQTRSFSIHQTAEINHFTKEQIEQQYDRLERTMLDDFYDYVRTRPTHMWLHWNMRNINYGFQAIAHRYRILGGQPIEIHESQLIDLSNLLVLLYGVRYINHPRMTNLTELNKITKKDFLSGQEEANAFDNKEYYKLHQSTLRKVDILASIAERAHRGTLKTYAKLKDIYGSYPEAIGELIKEDWRFAAIAFISAITSIIGLIITIYTLYR